MPAFPPPQKRGGALFPQEKRKELQGNPWRVGFGLLIITGHRHWVQFLPGKSERLDALMTQAKERCLWGTVLPETVRVDDLWVLLL